MDKIPARVRNCITHSHACDCREWKIAQEIKRWEHRATECQGILNMELHDQLATLEVQLKESENENGIYQAAFGLIMGMCGTPDPAVGCRNILTVAKATQLKMKRTR